MTNTDYKLTAEEYKVRPVLDLLFRVEKFEKGDSLSKKSEARLQRFLVTFTTEGTALAFALFLRVETIGVSVASPVTEGFAASHFTVKEPSWNARTTRARFDFQRANI